MFAEENVKCIFAFPYFSFNSEDRQNVYIAFFAAKSFSNKVHYLKNFKNENFAIFDCKLILKPSLKLHSLKEMYSKIQSFNFQFCICSKFPFFLTMANFTTEIRNVILTPGSEILHFWRSWSIIKFHSSFNNDDGQNVYITFFVAKSICTTIHYINCPFLKKIQKWKFFNFLNRKSIWKISLNLCSLKEIPLKIHIFNF